MSRRSPRDPCRNGCPVHEGKAGVLGRARPVLAVSRRQRGGRGSVPAAEELVRGQLPPAVDKILWQKKRLLKIQGKIWSRRIPAFTVHWKFLGSSWTFTQVEIILLDCQKCFAGSRTKLQFDPQLHINTCSLSEQQLLKGSSSRRSRHSSCEGLDGIMCAALI